MHWRGYAASSGADPELRSGNPLRGTATGEQKDGYDSAARKYPQATNLKLFSNLCQNVPAKNLLLVLTLGAPVILPIALLSLSGLLARSLLLRKIAGTEFRLPPQGPLLLRKSDTRFAPERSSGTGHYVPVALTQLIFALRAFADPELCSDNRNGVPGRRKLKFKLAVPITQTHYRER